MTLRALSGRREGRGGRGRKEGRGGKGGREGGEGGGGVVGRGGREEQGSDVVRHSSTAGATVAHLVPFQNLHLLVLGLE